MILVFGKTGQVATELQRQADVTAVDRKQADLSDPNACAQLIRTLRPSIVINAAAYTAVDKAEDEEPLAHVINADAPGLMASACAAQDIPFLHLSTDYVFEGSGETPWTEADPTNPQNAYGRTKLAGEQAVRASGVRHIILRTSWVFSSHGKNFVDTMLRLSDIGNELRVVEDQIGGPTPASDIAATVLTLATALQDGADGGTYHYAGHPYVSWADFARQIFEEAVCEMTVTGIPSSEYRTPANRPMNSRLDCSKITTDFGIPPADWPNRLGDVIRDLQPGDLLV